MFKNPQGLRQGIPDLHASWQPFGCEPNALPKLCNYLMPKILALQNGLGIHSSLNKPDSLSVGEVVRQVLEAGQFPRVAEHHGIAM